jgi:hypothetical protein
MRERLTNKQLSVFCFTQSYFRDNDQIPPARLVSEYVGCGDRTAGYHHLRTLEKKGYLERNTAGGYRFKRSE